MLVCRADDPRDWPKGITMTGRIFALRNVISGGVLVLTAGLGTAGVASAGTADDTPTKVSHVSGRPSASITPTPTDVGRPEPGIRRGAPHRY